MSDNYITFYPNTKAKSSEVNYNFSLTNQKIEEILEWKKEIDTKVTSNLGFNLFDTKIVDHILTGDAARGWMLQGSLVTYTYISAVDAIKSYYENGVSTTYRGISCKRAENKMYIADIGQKSAIDKLFNSTGVADFYIVDRLNNQFYLPRTKWFQQLTLDTSIVNNYTEAGIPNITGNTSVWGTNYAVDGAFKLGQQSGNRLKGGPDDFRWTVSFDASRCNSRYGKSNTVQPTSSLKLLYYKVGDTYANIDNMLINAQEILQANLDEIEEAGTDAINNITSYKSIAISDIEEAGVAAAQLSKDWAIKMDGKVNDEDYSSKYYADLAKDVIPAGGLQDEVLAKQSDADYDYKWTSVEGGLGANKDLSNLNPEGEKHFLNKSQITNCLLEVPQRVNVELNSDHQLILKAGSVVIVPYGTSAPTMEIGDTLNYGEIVDISWDNEKLFYYVKYDSDMSIYNLYSSDRTVFAGTNNNIVDMPITTTFSQDSAPTIPSGNGGYAIWYDTASNIIKYTTNNGSSWTEYYSLPFALMSPYYESIKNIFNGFGFIGSTVWCDKGVKWLLPDGRNTDGSLKNAIQETDKLNLATRTFTVTVPQIVGLSYSEKKINIVSTYYYEQVTPPQVIGSALWYNPLQNLIYYKSNGGSDWILMDIIKIGTIMPLSSTTADSRISVFFKNNTFNALDSNNTEFIAHQAMPGSNYIDLSLPASEGTLVAPADGYAVINATSTTSSSYISLNIKDSTNTIGILQDLKMVPEIGKTIATSLPVAKGELIQVGYYGITLKSFRFIYANGSL